MRKKLSGGADNECRRSGLSVYSLPLGESTVQAVAVGFIYLFTLRGGTGTGGEAHRGPHAQEQLRANVQPARSQRYQQQRRVSAMKMIYLVSYWVPFPASEYGGVQVVIAEDDAECVRILIDGADSWEKEAYPNYADCIIEQVKGAKKFPVDADECGIVHQFIT
jgi:hypothetical protein